MCGMLTLGPVGIQLSLFSRLARARVPLLQALQIAENEEPVTAAAMTKAKSESMSQLSFDP